MGNERDVTAGLRDRCKQFYQKAQRDAMLRQGSPVDDLVAFVLSERGRSADAALEGSAPLILYFATDADREEMIAAIREAKPGMVTVTKKMP